MDLVSTYLASRSFHACSEWIEGCVEFFENEHRGQNYTNSELLEFVAQQWELADLREISPGCLPPNLADHMKLTLPGKYSVQVESMLNIAQPCYAQMQKIRQVCTENVEISEKAPASWEPKGNRMFQLVLCDGVQEVKAIEYRPMQCLNKPHVPGTKVILIGPVDCRRGVILLQEHNLQVVGGEVDSLIIPNATENILARKLQLPENPDPYSNPEHASLPTVMPAEEPHTVTTLQMRVHEEIQFPDDDEILDHQMNAQLAALEQQYQPNNVPNDVEQEQWDAPDNWTELEKRYEEDIRDLDELDLQDQEPVSVERPSLSTERQRKEYGQTSFAHQQQSNGEWGGDGLDSLNTQDEQSLLGLCEEAEQSFNDNNLQIKPQVVANMSSFTSNSVGKNVACSITETKCPPVQVSSKQPFISQPEERETLPLSVPKESRTIKRELTKQEHNSSRPVDRCVTVMTCSPTDTAVFAQEMPKEECLTSTNSRDKAVITLNPHPFVYLCHVVNVPIVSNRTYIVKGFILTLLSSLSVANAENWQLKAKVSDGSAVLDVNFSSDVLEKLIGFSPREMATMKKEMAKNPLLKEKTTKALKKAQQVMINLNCRLHIHFTPGEELPCIVDIEDITQQHQDALKQRLKDYSSQSS